MLQQLTVENYALIRHLSIRFESGFTVITGETGAGKSILIGALGLILGQRADSTALLDQNSKCIVEGVFSGKGYDLEPFFAQNDLDFDETIILRREITPAGKSRAFINDTPVNLNLVRELGEKLVDIHSQHAILTLNDPSFQLSITDEYAGNRDLLSDYRQYYKQLQLLKSRLAQLKLDEANARKDQDYFTFLLNEMMDARLVEGEKEHIENELKLQEHAEEIKINLFQAHVLLNHGEGDVISQIGEITSLLRKISAHHQDTEKILQRIESVLVELKDVSLEIGRCEESVIYDPDKMEELTRRINVIYHLEQKHRVKGISELLAIVSDLQNKLNNLFSLEEDIKKVQEEILLKQDVMNQLDKQLTDGRKKVLKPVGDELTNLVRQLGMPDAMVQMTLQKLDLQGPEGSDRVFLLFNANKGGNLRQVSEIASGGELSRLMLSVKHVLSKRKNLPTLIFDEIDIGISGEIAARMGNMMQGMAQSMQVITITHLPQIAGKAPHHMLVYKENDDGSVHSKIRSLSREDRIFEIAKMLSDEYVSEVSLMKARELMG